MATEKKNKKDSSNKSVALVILSLLGVLLVISMLTAIGKGNAKGVGIATILIGAIIAFMTVPTYLEEKTQKNLFYVLVAAFFIFSSIIAMIADPIALNNRCQKFATLQEYTNAPLRETSGCYEWRKELEQKDKEERQAKDAKKRRELEKKQKACKETGLDWNYSENRCNTEEEQKISELKKQCSAKNYQWNYDAKRCNNDAEQKQYEEKQAAEKAKREAEEKAKREAEEKAKQEQKKTEQSQSTSNSSAVYPSGISSTDELEPGEVKSLCNRTMKKAGISEIKSITNAYPMGYPEEIFVLVGITKSNARVQCQINWQKWTVKAVRINGTLVYGN